MDWFWDYGGWLALGLLVVLFLCLVARGWFSKPVKHEDYRPDIGKYQRRNPPKDGEQD